VDNSYRPGSIGFQVMEAVLSLFKTQDRIVPVEISARIAQLGKRESLRIDIYDRIDRVMKTLVKKKQVKKERGGWAKVI
jgi:hypothetical protein